MVEADIQKIPQTFRKSLLGKGSVSVSITQREVCGRQTTGKEGVAGPAEERLLRKGFFVYIKRKLERGWEGSPDRGKMASDIKQNIVFVEKKGGFDDWRKKLRKSQGR